MHGTRASAPAPRPAIFISREVLVEADPASLDLEHNTLLVMVGQEPEVGRGGRFLIDVERDIDQVRTTLLAAGVELDAVAYCPHHPEARDRDLRTCDCRAPEPGLFLRTRDEFGIDLSVSWAVTRSPVEQLAAARAGVGHVGEAVAEVPAALRHRRPPETSRWAGAAEGSGLLFNRRFGSAPVVVHANGRARLRRGWDEVRQACFTAEGPDWPPRSAPGVTVLTWNTSPPTLGQEDYSRYLSSPRQPGMLEASLGRLGAHCEVLGRGRVPLTAMVDKLTMLVDALDTVRTPLVAGIDSYDAVALAPPSEMAARFVEDFDCGLLFGAEYSCWPRPLGEFARIAAFQRTVARGGVPYLQAGMWIGEVEACREFFIAAAAAPMKQVAKESMPPNLASWEQPHCVWMLPAFYPRVQVDHCCRIFQSLTCPEADVQVRQATAAGDREVRFSHP